MAVRPMTSERKPFTPTPVGLHRGVFVDVYYDWDKESTFEGATTIKDYVYLAVELDPAVGLTIVNDQERPFWVAQRYSIVGDRMGPDNRLVNRVDYQHAVLKNRDNILPVLRDAAGEPQVFIGPKHTIYKQLVNWGGPDFPEAYAKGLVSLEKMIGHQCKVLVKHGNPDKNGQVWPRISDLFPPDPGQSIKPSGFYIRTKDRPKDDDESKEGDLPF